MLFQTPRLSIPHSNHRSPKNSELSILKSKKSRYQGQDKKEFLKYMEDPKRSFFFNKHVTVLKTGTTFFIFFLTLLETSRNNSSLKIPKSEILNSLPSL